MGKRKTDLRVDTMRIIDRYVGIPACFILSALLKLMPVDKHGQLSNMPQKILLIELSEVGSSILAMPAINYLKQRYPEARLFALTFVRNRPFFELIDIVPKDNILNIDPTNLFSFLRTTVLTLLRARRIGIDTIIDFELFSRFSALFAGMCGARHRIGYYQYHQEGLYRGDIQTHPVYYNCHQHMARNFMVLVKAIEANTEIPLLKAHVDLPESPKSIEHDANALGSLLARLSYKIADTIKNANPLIMLNPSAGDQLPIRAWPIENYIQLADKFIKRHEACIVVIGLDDAEQCARQLIRSLGRERCIDLTGATNANELFALVAFSDLLVTSDGGPAHLATLSDTPAIVFFGPETPHLYAPLGRKINCLHKGLACSPCLSAFNHRRTPCRDAKCLKSITVDEAYCVALKYLEGNQPEP